LRIRAVAWTVVYLRVGLDSFVIRRGNVS